MTLKIYCKNGTQYKQQCRIFKTLRLLPSQGRNAIQNDRLFSNENINKEFHNIWNAANAVLKGEVITINAYINK